MRFLANYEDVGLGKLHCDPREECNADEAKDKRYLDLRQALKLLLWEGSARPQITAEQVEELLCKHCIK